MGSESRYSDINEWIISSRAQLCNLISRILRRKVNYLPEGISAAWRCHTRRRACNHAVCKPCKDLLLVLPVVKPVLAPGIQT